MVKSKQTDFRAKTPEEMEEVVVEQNQETEDETGPESPEEESEMVDKVPSIKGTKVYDAKEVMGIMGGHFVAVISGQISMQNARVELTNFWRSLTEENRKEIAQQVLRSTEQFRQMADGLANDVYTMALQDAP